MSTKQRAKGVASTMWSGTKRAGRGTRSAATAVRQRTTQVYCTYCDPMHYVRKADWPDHRKWAKDEAQARVQASRAAIRAAATTAHRPAAPPPGTRRVNPTKNGGKAAPMGRNGTPTIATETIVEAFRAIVMAPPGSLPAEKVTAEQMADMFTVVADLYRRLVETRFEHGFAPEVLEPYQQISRAMSRCADLHMEVYASANRRYGELAALMARRDTPIGYVTAGRR